MVTGRLSYSDPDHWPHIHRLRNSPPPSATGALATWIHTQYFPNPYEAMVSAAFDTVMTQHVGTNECWLAISGPAHLGKTSTVVQVLLRRAMADAQSWRTRTEAGHLLTPYVYVEAASNQEARGLLAAIARACGLPDQGNEKDLHQMLTGMLPRLGVKLIVVDDAQMYRRVSDNASRLTDGLRHLLHLPTPFAFVGIDLERSALLRFTSRNNDTALQMYRRHIWRAMRPLEPTAKHDIRTLLEGFTRRMSKIEDLRLDGLNDRAVLHKLLASHEGRPGSILNALKRATVEAITRNDGNLSSDLIAAEAALDPGRGPT